MNSISLPLPQRIHVYQNHHLDSSRWDGYRPRNDDIIITTSYKSGTTWMQSIVRELIVADMLKTLATDSPLLPLPGDGASPWPDARWTGPIEEIYAKIEAQQHRRFLKSHLPLDGLPYYPQVRYLIIGRDPRDVFMSLWNHYQAYTDHFYVVMNDDPTLPGLPFPRLPADIHEFWQGWINRGWFAWEQDGYPFWGNMHHTVSYWRYRHLNNFLFVHYNDLLTDPATEIGRIATFLRIAVDAPTIAAIVDHTQFDAMKQRAIAQQTERTRPETFRGGPTTFFHKGTNGRWRAVLSAEELAMYEAAKARILTPDCAAWLEGGRMGVGSPVPLP